MNLFELAQVARIPINSIGPDFDSFIVHVESEAREKALRSSRCGCPLSSPFAPMATDILRGHGYFLGGMLPCRADGDGLLMQKLGREPDWEAMVLSPERSRKIGEVFRRDWKRVTKG